MEKPVLICVGQLRAHLTLEDADTTPVDQLNQTLCVLLGGQPDNAAGLKHCARDANGVILFKGDWCSTSNVSDDCGDAMRLVVDFAASAVAIN